MIFKFKYENIGGFIHVNFFAGKRIESLAKLGELHFREEEFDRFQNIMRIGETYQGNHNEIVEVVFVKDNPDV